MAIIKRAPNCTGLGGFKLRLYSNKGIIIAASVFFALSTLDAVLTLWGLNLNVIREANPVMRVLITKHPQLFLILKLLTPVALGLYCWWNRYSDRRLVTYALGIAVGIYVVVSLFHLYWIVLYKISLTPFVKNLRLV